MALACLRASIALYLWATITAGYTWLVLNTTEMPVSDVGLPTLTLLLDRGFIVKSFSYFTFITYWSLAFYFTISAAHTFSYAFNLRRGRTGNISLLHDSLPRFLQMAHAVWHTSITTLPFLVTIVYWSTMYAIPWSTATAFVRFINISFHGLNSLFAICEIIFSAAGPPPFFSHLTVVSLLLALYLALAYLTKFTQDFYPYPWMAPMFGWQGIVAHVFGYGGGMVVIYAMVWAANWLRERIVVAVKARKNGPMQVMDEETNPTSSQFSSTEVSRRTSLSEKKAPKVEVSAV
jgi:hypothetical protein